MSYPLRVALGELAVQSCTRRIELSPLSATAVATLAAGSGLDAAELYEVTGGNPFYVVEELHTWAGTGCRRRRGTRCWPGPRGLARKPATRCTPRR